MGIYDLPIETVEEILLHADPIDVATLSQASRLFSHLIYYQKDEHLWRWLYLRQDLDDPRECVHMSGKSRRPDEIDWRTQLQRIMRTRTVLENASVCRPSERNTILSTVISLVEWVPPLPAQSRNLAWVGHYLADRRLIDPHVKWTQDSEESQLRAKLHTYFGQTPQDRKSTEVARSRAYVYDFRHYQYQTDFGPFFEDQRVNWEFMQTIGHAVAAHVDDLDDRNLCLPFTQISMPTEEQWKHDWAGVEGAWECGFCFCDHVTLMEYNQSASEDGGPLNTVLFEDMDNDDVFRCIQVNLRILKVVVDHKYPRYPRIHFGGDMSTMSGATMSGSVYMTRDNHVRWTFRSGEQANPIWSSEGIQVGGIRSKYGVLGTWTTTFHQPHDPVGPFWLRKLVE